MNVTRTPVSGKDQTTQKPEAPQDPRLSEIVGFADVVRSSGYSLWTLHHAYRRGDITGYPVPGGAVGLYRPHVERFVAAHRRKLAEKNAKKRADGEV
jgi:hypothetical protein